MELEFTVRSLGLIPDRQGLALGSRPLSTSSCLCPVSQLPQLTMASNKDMRRADLGASEDSLRSVSAVWLTEASANSDPLRRSPEDQQ